MATLKDAAVRDRLVQRLQYLEPASIRRWGKMTSHEAICHLNDAFIGVLGDKHISPAPGWLQNTTLWRNIAKFFGLRSPIPWPHNLPSRPEVAQDGSGTPPVASQRDRRALIETIDRFRASEVQLRTCAHPIFGPLTFDEWQRWGYLHIDHHLRQFGA